MFPRHPTGLLLVVSCCLCWCRPAAAADQAPDPSLMDGGPRLVVTMGTSLTREWPLRLQRKLYRYFDANRKGWLEDSEVRRFSKGGTYTTPWKPTD